MKSCTKVGSTLSLKHSGKAGSLWGALQAAAAVRPRRRDLESPPNSEGSLLHTQLNCQISGSGAAPRD